MIKLYDFALSGHAYAARLMLSILGQDYETVPVDLMNGEQREADFLAINPFGQVPVLDDGGVIVRDSHAVVAYLGRKFGGDTWMPQEPKDLARVQEWLSVSSGELFRGPVVARLAKVFKIPAFDYDAAAKTSRDLLAKIEAHLGGRDWLALDRPTVADISCYPYLAALPESDIGLEDYPSLRAWIGRVEALPGFVPAG